MATFIIKTWSAISYYYSDRLNHMLLNNPDVLDIYPIYTRGYQLYMKNTSWYPIIKICGFKQLYYYVLLAYYLLIPGYIIPDDRLPLYDYTHIINLSKEAETDTRAITKINVPIPIEMRYNIMPIIIYGRHVSSLNKYILYSQLRNIRDNRGKYMMVTLNDADITDIYNKLAHYYDIFIRDTFASRKKYLRQILLLELNKTDVKDMRDYKLILINRDLTEIEINV
jgi:hypothetical protein